MRQLQRPRYIGRISSSDPRAVLPCSISTDAGMGSDLASEVYIGDGEEITYGSVTEAASVRSEDIAEFLTADELLSTGRGQGRSSSPSARRSPYYR